MLVPIEIGPSTMTQLETLIKVRDGVLTLPETAGKSGFRLSIYKAINEEIEKIAGC